MQKVSLWYTPRVTPRYWAAIMLASMCGTNLGDFFPDVIGMGLNGEVAVLAASFVVLRMVDALLPGRMEAIYWVTILVVRAAATAAADYLVASDHSGFVEAGLRLAAAFASLVALIHVSRRSASAKPPSDEVYWSTMLVAGTLGTVIGDGVGHAFSSVQIGVPVSALLATTVLALLLWKGGSKPWRQGSFYWVAIVAVRWWGTNLGDILKFLTSIPVSMAATGLALALLLWLWKEQPGEPEKAEAAPISGRNLLY